MIPQHRKAIEPEEKNTDMAPLTCYGTDYTSSPCLPPTFTGDKNARRTTHHRIPTNQTAQNQPPYLVETRRQLCQPMEQGIPK